MLISKVLRSSVSDWNGVVDHTLGVWSCCASYNNNASCGFIVTTHSLFSLIVYYLNVIDLFMFYNLIDKKSTLKNHVFNHITVAYLGFIS